MRDNEWVLLDTETTGFNQPIFVVEIAAQRMLGWEPKGPPFRKLLNQNTDIPPEAARVHGYTREILERDGEPALNVYRDFSDYVGNLPLVAYNLEYDLDDVLIPEWQRLGIRPIGHVGFCAMRLAQRLLDPVPAGNHKLQTLRQYYRLPERGAHTALGDVETVADLMATVLRPIAQERGLNQWSDIVSFASSVWFPSRIAFGKHKGRDFRDATEDNDLHKWLEWLSQSTNGRSSQMGTWYLDKLRGPRDAEPIWTSPLDGNIAADPPEPLSDTTTETVVTVYINPEIEALKNFIAAARKHLAEVESTYTKERRSVDLVQAEIFSLVREQY
jgi:DNA polymerase-3 subunit epsilon